MRRNTEYSRGFESLLAALTAGDHGCFLDRSELMRKESTQIEGNGMLGYLIGSKT